MTLEEERRFSWIQLKLLINHSLSLIHQILTFPSSTRTTRFLDSLRRLFNTIEFFPIPTIAAISSLALGGGLELALTTTFRVFARTALVGLPETRLGIIPGAGGTYRLPSLIGPTRARDLILTGRRVDGVEAFRIGLCDRLVGEENTNVAHSPTELRARVLDEAVAMAREICKGAPVATMNAFHALLKPSREAEERHYENVLKTEDRVEGLRAFKEKRAVVFKGR